MFDQATDYKRIYILQELENWMKEHNVTAEPSWLPNAVAQAMASRNSMLIQEAIKLIGKYKYTSFRDSLVVLYRDAHARYTPEANQIRSEIIHAVNQFDKATRDSIILQLFTIKPRYYQSGEFYSLVKALSECGNAGHQNELRAIAREIDQRMKEIDQTKDPYRNYGAYERALKEVVATGLKIKERN
jgi:hypothetical protein